MKIKSRGKESRGHNIWVVDVAGRNAGDEFRYPNPRHRGQSSNDASSRFLVQLLDT